MWLNEQTAWTWERLWPLEAALLGRRATRARLSRHARPVLEQATRELLLAQSSDWQFIISTGAAADYAERRFQEHCDDAEALVAALRSARKRRRRRPRAATGGGAGRRDDLFPDVLPAVAAALGGLPRPWPSADA